MIITNMLMFLAILTNLVRSSTGCGAFFDGPEQGRHFTLEDRILVHTRIEGLDLFPRTVRSQEKVGKIYGFAQILIDGVSSLQLWNPKSSVNIESALNPVETMHTVTMQVFRPGEEAPCSVASLDFTKDSRPHRLAGVCMVTGDCVSFQDLEFEEQKTQAKIEWGLGERDKWNACGNNWI